MARKVSDLKRRRGARRPARLIVCICGGAVTEPSYINGLAREFRKPSVKVEVVAKGVDPLALVKMGITRKKELERAARKSKNSFDTEFDVWVVTDTDDFPQMPDARIQAEKSGIFFVQSNPCFEVWAIYHYTDYDSPDDSKDCQRRLEELCPEYDRSKNKRFPFEQLNVSLDERLKMLETAIARGQAGLQRRIDEDSPNGRPSSEMHELVKIIRTV